MWLTPGCHTRYISGIHMGTFEELNVDLTLDKQTWDKDIAGDHQHILKITLYPKKSNHTVKFYRQYRTDYSQCFHPVSYRTRYILIQNKVHPLIQNTIYPIIQNMILCLLPCSKPFHLFFWPSIQSLKVFVLCSLYPFNKCLSGILILVHFHVQFVHGFRSDNAWT